MSDSTLQKAINNIVKNRNVAELLRFLDDNKEQAADVISLFSKLHQKHPYQKILNFLDLALLPNYGKYAAYERALAECEVNRIYPRDLDTTQATDNATIAAIRYMVAGAFPEDRKNTTLLFRFRNSSGSNSNNTNTSADISSHDRKSQSYEFYSLLEQKLGARLITPVIKA